MTSLAVGVIVEVRIAVATCGVGVDDGVDVARSISEQPLSNKANR
jgi:hypothetical protein